MRAATSHHLPAPSRKGITLPAYTHSSTHQPNRPAAVSENYAVDLSAYGQPPMCPHGPKRLDVEAMPDDPHWVCPEGALTTDACFPARALAPIAQQDSGDDPTEDEEEKAETPRPKAPRSWARSEWEWEWQILHCPDVARADKAVGLVASRRANFENGKDAYPSQAWIAGVLGYATTSPVAQALRSLVEDGWLHRDGYGPTGPSGYRPHRYRLTVPKCDHITTRMPYRASSSDGHLTDVGLPFLVTCLRSTFPYIQ